MELFGREYLNPNIVDPQVSDTQNNIISTVYNWKKNLQDSVNAVSKQNFSWAFWWNKEPDRKVRREDFISPTIQSDGNLHLYIVCGHVTREERKPASYICFINV